MSNPNLELAFKQFHSIRDHIEKAGISLNVRELKLSIERGLDELAEGIRVASEPRAHQRRIVQVAGSDNRIYALDEDGELWEMNHSGRWDLHPGLPNREVKTQ
jgi:hypothetical protein